MALAVSLNKGIGIAGKVGIFPKREPCFVCICGKMMGPCTYTLALRRRRRCVQYVYVGVFFLLNFLDIFLMIFWLSFIEIK